MRTKLNRLIAKNYITPSRSAVGALLLACTSLTTTGLAQLANGSRYETIVQTGAATPESGVTMNAFNRVVFNNNRLGFESTLNGAVNTSNDQAIVAWAPFNPSGLFSGQMIGFVREGTSVGNGATLNMNVGNRQLSINEAGGLGFNTNLSGTGGTNNDTAVYIVSFASNPIDSTLTELMREGSAVPGGGTVQNIGTGILDVQFRGIDNFGNTYFQDVIPDSPGAPLDDWRFFQASPTGLSAIGIEGQPAPSGGNYLTFSGYEMNDVGEAIVTGSTAIANIGVKIWFKDASGTMSEIVNSVATGGSNTPVGQLRSISAGFPMLNNAGDVVFVGWTSVGGTGSADSFLMRTDKAGAPISVLLAEGSATPDGNGVFDNLVVTASRFNNAGQFASGLALRGTANGINDNTGIYRIDPDQTATKLFREGDSALSGNGSFGELASSTQFAMNDSGMVAMMTNYTGTAGGVIDNTAIVATDGIDYFEIAREGTAKNGSTVSSIEFSNGVMGNDATTSGLNNFGQIAYVERLANNMQSVQVWTPELHHRGGTGSMANGQDWTLSIAPQSVHDVYLDSDVASLVHTDMQVLQVRNIEIGSGLATSQLQGPTTGFDTVRVDGNTTLYDNGVIAGGIRLETNGLYGTGRILGEADISAGDSVFVSGTLSPGFSPGRMEINTFLSLGSNSQTLIELGGTGLGEYDQVFGLFSPTSAGLQLDGTLQVSLYNGFELSDGMSFTIFDLLDSSETQLGQFAGLDEAGLVGVFGNQNLYISYQGGTGNDVVLYTSVVPEPTSAGLIVVMAGMACCIRRRRGTH